MKKIYTVLLLCITSIAQANDFITVWNLSHPGSSSTAISFGVGTIGVVNYTWETIPAGILGSGTFMGSTATITGLPAGATIRLKINPTNFKRIEIYAGNDYKRIVDIEQWGSVSWSTMLNAFNHSDNLNISAIDLPDLSLVTSCSSMFSYCVTLNGPSNINQWNISNITNMNYMFNGASSFNQPIGSWNMSNVIYMNYVFGFASSFNQPIGNWNTGNVTDMAFMFSGASSFNQPIGNWNTGNVTDMAYMFSGATSFNESIGSWDVTNVNYMTNMFTNAVAFNQPIGNWNISSVTHLGGMFDNAVNFNQPIGNWNTGNVINMGLMFDGATSFNQPIGNWDISNVIYIESMFSSATSFNQPIGNWNTGSVLNMNNMFNGATSFNQSIGNWNTSNVTNMVGLFYDAILFNQPLGNWNLTAVSSLQGMLDNCGMNCSNYSATLNGWANNSSCPTGILFTASGIHYGTNVVADRNYLDINKSWAIVGDILDNNSCLFGPTQSPSPSSVNSFCQLSPNPVKSILDVRSTVSNATISIYNAIGQKLFFSQISNLNNQISIDLSTFANGIYFVEIKDDGKIFRTKILKQ